jgi:cholesterol oxidase
MKFSPKDQRDCDIPRRQYSAAAWYLAVVFWVVFSGGVLGTIKLLFECKAKGFLPNISKTLGQSVRTNSEALLTVTANDPKADYSDHIAITSGIYPDQKTHIEVVRYNKGSDVMGSLLTILTGGGGRIPRVIRFFGNILRHPWAFLKSFWIFGWGARTPILLVMQTAENKFQFNYKRRWWRLGKKTINSEISPNSQKIPSYIPIANQVAKRMGEKINGQPMSAWTEVLCDISSTAHILGGCAMGESAEDGVVDFAGSWVAAFGGNPQRMALLILQVSFTATRIFTLSMVPMSLSI